MSQSLLSKTKAWRPKKPLSQSRDWRAIIAFPAWVFVSFIAAQLIIGGVIWVSRITGLELSQLGSIAVIETIAAASVYVMAFAITFGVPYAFNRRVTLETLGLKRLMSWLDIGLAPLAYITYVLILVAVLAVVTQLFPGFQADQAQDVGFKGLSNQTGYLLAFTTLVVIAPIAEEVLFRGYLYGKMHRHVPFWAAAVATSLLFAFVHGQWNVAVDTFILSMVLCGLRQLTGSIWAGILVHMIKNAIAFYILFIAPVVSTGLGS